jgi:hypothetical protein
VCSLIDCFVTELYAEIVMIMGTFYYGMGRDGNELYGNGMEMGSLANGL